VTIHWTTTDEIGRLLNLTKTDALVRFDNKLVPMLFRRTGDLWYRATDGSGATVQITFGEGDACD
jgi:hypothetical protein